MLELYGALREVSGLGGEPGFAPARPGELARIALTRRGRPGPRLAAEGRAGRRARPHLGVGVPGGRPLVTKLVRVEVAGRAATVTLDRPEALNAISTELATELADAVEPLATDPGVRAVVLTGAGERAFCVGADLKQRAGFDDHGWFVQREAFRRGFAAVRQLPRRRWRPCPASPSAAAPSWPWPATWWWPATTPPLAARGPPRPGPGRGGTQLLVRRVGRSVAKDLVLTGRRVPAPEAHRLGLVDRVVPWEVLAAATAPAAEIAANALTAVRMAKWALDLGADLAQEAAMEVEDQARRRAVLSDDRREGIAAWVERRDPEYQRLASLRACSVARSSSNQIIQPSGSPSTPQRSERASNRSRPGRS